MPEWHLLLKQVISASYMNNDLFYLILIQMQKTKIGVGDKKKLKHIKMHCNISKSFVHSTPRRSQEYLIFKEKSYMKSKNEMSIIVVIKSSDEEEYTGRKVQDDRTFMPSIGPPQILQVTWMWLA